MAVADLLERKGAQGARHGASAGKASPRPGCHWVAAVRPSPDSEFELRFLRCCSADSSKVGHSRPWCRKPGGRAPWAGGDKGWSGTAGPRGKRRAVGSEVGRLRHTWASPGAAHQRLGKVVQGKPSCEPSALHPRQELVSSDTRDSTRAHVVPAGHRLQARPGADTFLPAARRSYVSGEGSGGPP